MGWFDLISNATAVFNTSFLSEIKRKKQVKCFCQKKASEKIFFHYILGNI